MLMVVPLNVLYEQPFGRFAIIFYLCTMQKEIQHSWGERRTATVVVFTLIVMVSEFVVGVLTHSMALLAEGTHMGSHVLVLGLSWAAYLLVRRLQRRGNERWDTNRILNLSAYTSGVFLLLVSVFILVEAFSRFLHPEVDIAYGQALVMAAVGCITNFICAYLLHGHHGDVNSRAAYLHILSDVLTDLGAILGLLCGLFWGISYVDAVVALVASCIVGRWAVRLLWTTGRALTEDRSTKDTDICKQ